MRLLVQRVTNADVTVAGDKIAGIGKGLLLFLGIIEEDGEKDIEYLVQKVARLRVFDDENGVMNRSVTDIGGEVLVVSQFTLQACTKKGNRPSYIRAARPETAIPLYEQFIRAVSYETGKPAACGQFGADMKVGLVNDGPVTIWIDSKNKDY